MKLGLFAVILWSFSAHSFELKRVPEPKLNEALAPFVDGSYGETEALLVYTDGALRYEQYRLGFDENKKHLGWSVAKSITTTILGIAVKDGTVKLDDPVTKWVKEGANTAWDQVTLGHLATMTSGVYSMEGYEASPLNSTVVAMLYRFPFFKDMGGYRLTQRRVMAPPGDRFYYSSGDTALLSKALTNALGGSMRALFKDRIAKPLGITRFTFEEDGSGTLVGSSYFYTTAIDFLKLGLLYLDGGKWDGEQLLPEDWSKRSGNPSSAFKTLRLDNVPSDLAYGLGFWLNQPVPTAQIGKYYSSVPADAYWMKGHQHQHILVIPSKKTVIVRLGRDGLLTGKFSMDEMYKALSRAMNWGVAP